MRESSFWTSARKQLPQGCRSWRIENGLSSGTPDVFSCWQGVRFWIELKYRPSSPRDTTILFGDKHGIRPSQRAFWLEYLRCGGRGLIMWGVEREQYYLPMTLVVLDGFNRWTWAEAKIEGMNLRDRSIEQCLVEMR